MKILVLNSGSSSLKAAVYEIKGEPPEDPPAAVWEGDKVPDEWDGQIDAVGHRIVHGGPKFLDPVLITPEVKAAIADAARFAPLHNGIELAAIEAVAQRMPDVPQVAVFDTGFHKTIPLFAAAYPGPYEWLDAGIRRYGFHGINHQYCARRAAQPRVVSCHLGNGCSLAAIKDGKSVDTTMGFTPLEGLMMGTRSGSVDPGILTFLMRERGLDGKQLDELLNTKSGLLGISGVSADMRKILAAMKEGDQRAQLAFDMFVHRLISGIGAMIAVLGGLDVLVFTGGIGENSPEVRGAACKNLAYAGVTDSSVRVMIIKAQEDWEIARETWLLCR